MKLDISDKYQRKYDRFDTQIDQDLEEIKSKSNVQLENLRKGRDRQTESEQSKSSQTTKPRPKPIALEPNRSLEKRLAGYKLEDLAPLPSEKKDSDEEEDLVVENEVTVDQKTPRTEKDEQNLEENNFLSSNNDTVGEPVQDVVINTQQLSLGASTEKLENNDTKSDLVVLESESEKSDKIIENIDDIKSDPYLDIERIHEHTDKKSDKIIENIHHNEEIQTTPEPAPEFTLETEPTTSDPTPTFSLNSENQPQEKPPQDTQTIN